MKLPGEFVPWVLSHDLHCRAFLWHKQDQDQWSQTPRIIAHQRNRLIHPVIGFIDSLKPGFHMIATIAEKKKVQRWLSLRSLESGFHMIAAIADFFFSAIAAITAIIWKPSLTVTNPWKDLQQARREAGRFTRRKGLYRSFLGYLGLSLQQLCTRSIAFL